MTPIEIMNRASREQLKHTTARDIRVLLDAVSNDNPEDWDELEAEILELVTAEE